APADRLWKRVIGTVCKRVAVNNEQGTAHHDSLNFFCEMVEAKRIALPTDRLLYVCCDGLSHCHWENARMACETAEQGALPANGQCNVIGGVVFDTLKVTLEEAERVWQKPPAAASSPDVRLNHRSERAKRLE